MGPASSTGRILLTTSVCRVHNTAAGSPSQSESPHSRRHHLSLRQARLTGLKRRVRERSRGVKRPETDSRGATISHRKRPTTTAGRRWVSQGKKNWGKNPRENRAGDKKRSTSVVFLQDDTLVCVPSLLCCVFVSFLTLIGPLSVPPKMDHFGKFTLRMCLRVCSFVLTEPLGADYSSEHPRYCLADSNQPHLQRRGDDSKGFHSFPARTVLALLRVTR
jgi:hypothetical protein